MKKKNLSDVSSNKAKNNFNIGIVYSEWNEAVTYAMRDAAKQYLLEHGVAESQIKMASVPGSFELPLGASMMLDADEQMDGVICIGCVVQGETRHFDFICDAVAQGIMRVGLDYGVPVSFGVLTCNTYEQATDRAGGKHGNKGVEAAATCLNMIQLQRKI